MVSVVDGNRERRLKLVWRIADAAQCPFAYCSMER